MLIDYSVEFPSPEDVANFLMLSQEEQAKYWKRNPPKGAELSCTLNNRATETPSA